MYVYLYISRERERERENRQKDRRGGRKDEDDHSDNTVILKTACCSILEPILLTNGTEEDHAKHSIPSTSMAKWSTYLEILQTIRKSPYMGVVARFHICHVLKRKTELNESQRDN